MYCLYIPTLNQRSLWPSAPSPQKLAIDVGSEGPCLVGHANTGLDVERLVRPRMWHKNQISSFLDQLEWGP